MAAREIDLGVAASDPAALVSGNADALRTLLDNLVGNAVKFTSAGAVSVFLHARPRPGGTCELTVSVRDTGPGVRPEDLERGASEGGGEQGGGSSGRPVRAPPSVSR